MLSHINYFAVLAGTILSFILGAIWYSKILFGNIWKAHAGVDYARKHNPAIFGLTFLLSFFAALALAIALGDNPSFWHATGAGFSVGLFYVATSFAISYAFANRGWKLFLIDAGYHTLQFTIYGAVLGLWHWPSLQVATGMPIS